MEALRLSELFLIGAKPLFANLLLLPLFKSSLVGNQLTRAALLGFLLFTHPNAYAGVLDDMERYG